MHNPDPGHEACAAAPHAGPHVEVWNDLVSPRDLLVCLLVCGTCAVASLVLAALTGSEPLFWGLGGCVLGFAACCALVRPKREVVLVDDADGTGPRSALPAASGAASPTAPEGDR